MAIAVLCFGVFAAIKVTYTVSGNISYEVNDAYVEIDTKIYTSTTGYETASSFKTAAKQLETSTVSNCAFNVYVFGDWDSYDVVSNNNAPRAAFQLGL